jgi:hypothetical protein
MAILAVGRSRGIVRMPSAVDQSHLPRAGYRNRHGGRLNVFANAFGGFGD